MNYWSSPCSGRRVFAASSPLKQITVGRRRQRSEKLREDRPRAPVGSGLLAGFVVLVVVAAAVWPAWKQRKIFFSLSPEAVCRWMYSGNPFLECLKIAEYLNKNSGPDQRVAVLGSEPEVYFYAKRRSATGYIYTYSLMEIHPFASTMQQEMIQEIEAAKPEFIVMVDVKSSWLPGRVFTAHRELVASL